MRQCLFASVALFLVATPAMAQNNAVSTQSNNAALTAAINAPGRSDENKARDKYRHPYETLTFFGVKPESTVIELLPGGGWYTEILAPYLSAKGTLYLAQNPGRGLDTLKAKMAADAAVYGKVKYADFPLTSASVPDNSVDVILTFRNVHNLIMNSDSALATNVFAGAFRALKPGGILGVVDHRLPENRDTVLEKSSGYLKRSTIIALAETAGFKLAGESEINANPKDTADWEKGVWTLPPRLANGDVDRDKYLAIGESDRMTLKFVKP